MSYCYEASLLDFINRDYQAPEYIRKFKKIFLFFNNFLKLVWQFLLPLSKGWMSRQRHGERSPVLRVLKVFKVLKIIKVIIVVTLL